MSGIPTTLKDNFGTPLHLAIYPVDMVAFSLLPTLHYMVDTHMYLLVYASSSLFSRLV